MKKIIFAVILLVIVVTMSGCNRSLLDTHFTFDEAIVRMPDGTVISGSVSDWHDYEDGDQLQVTIDGVTYLTHASNVALIDR